MGTAAPSLEQILASLMKEVVSGKAHLTISVGIGKTDPAVLHTAPTFFGVTVVAHIEAAQMYAAKLFDKTSGTVTVESMLNRAKAEPGPFENGTPAQLRKAVEKSRKRIDGLKAPLRSIRDRRNQSLGHLDPRTVLNPGGLSTAAKLSLNELRTVFDETGMILNEISGIVRGITGFTKLFDVDDYENALTLIAEAKCAQIKQFESEFKEPWTGPGPRPRGCQ